MNYSHRHLITPALAAVIFTAISLPALVSGATATQAGSVFVPIIPCRLVDTRLTTGMTAGFGAPSLVANKARTLLVPSSSCAIPKALAYSANFVVVVPTGKAVGWLAAWPDDKTWPGTVVLNAVQGGVIGNSAIVAAGADGGIQVMATDNTDLVIDIYGYYLVGGAGTVGPTGPVGPAGPMGPIGIGVQGGQGATGASGVGASTTLVSPAGTTILSGTALVSAMTAACAQPLKWLVKIGPGTYDLGPGEELDLCLHVDVEGSGEGVTIITSQAFTTVSSVGGAVGELRYVTIENIRTGSNSNGAIMNASDWTFRHVTVKANSDSVAIGIASGVGLGTMDHVTLVATGVNAAVGVSSSAGAGLKISDSAITATGATTGNVAIENTDSPLLLLNSLLDSTADGKDINALGSGSAKVYGSVLRGGNLGADSGAVHIATSEVNSGVTLGGPGIALITCVASFNDSGVAVLAATCK